MYVCLCMGITDHQIREAVDNGAANMREVRRSLGVTSQCGKCRCVTRTIVREALDVDENSPKLFYAVA